jgi:succinate dehydrogenase/fumarate reductase flavoprotein subunit
MTINQFHPITSGTGTTPEPLELSADVLVLGGGPAGTWAALAARRSGAEVVLADKAHCGTSGATAAVGTGVWSIPPEPELREAAMASREAMNGFLSERRWMRRVLDETWSRMSELDQTGYPFPVDEEGNAEHNGLQGPDYMKRQRQRVARAGIRILDHSPALELLTDDDGSVAGVNGVNRQTGQPYTVRAGAVVVATGGCAFLSRSLGTNVDTGDGLLFAAEVGAEFSGMEFSNSYSIAPEGTSLTKSAYYSFGTFYHEDGSVLEGAGSQRGRSVIAKALLHERVYCQLDQIDAEFWPVLRVNQPNFFQPFDRVGINPFTQRFPVTLLLEGTVRGTGGIRILEDSCATSVPGLFAAGDAATRELICGGFTGGGSHNSAWAISSGSWAGAGAAEFAQSLGTSTADRRLHPSGGAGLRPTGSSSNHDYRQVVSTVQEEVIPYDKNYFRSETGLDASLGILDQLWGEIRSSLRADGVGAVKAREAAAMTATARWMYRSALARTETRGMHKRLDFPALDPTQHHRVLSGGLDEVWTAYEPVRDVETLDRLAASVAQRGAA